MFDLIIRNGHVVDPINHFDGLADVAIEDGHVAAVKSGLEASAKEELDTSGKYVIPGIIDMHTHMRTVLGHPHAQRMIALAGVCSTLDMAGPLDDILDSIPTSGASRSRPDALIRKNAAVSEDVRFFVSSVGFMGVGEPITAALRV